MKHKNGLLLGAVLGVFGIMAQSATAAEIKVLTTGAFKQVVVALVPEFEKATGHKVVVDKAVEDSIITGIRPRLHEGKIRKLMQKKSRIKSRKLKRNFLVVADVVKA